MKIYLAARYGRLKELNRYAAELRQKGHTVTSRWLDGDHQWADAEEAAGAIAESMPLRSSSQLEARRFADEDYYDIRVAQMLIAFTEFPSGLERKMPGPNDIEEWKLVPDSRLIYQVSSFGRVRNGEGELIEGNVNKGYRYIKPNGKYSERAAVHQLVAHLFIGPCPSDHEIDHIDGFKTNNWVGNLEYVTHAANVKRASRQMRGGPHAGVRNGRAKLTDYDVATIRHRARNGETKAGIARDYNVSATLISDIVRGKLWPVHENYGKGGRDVELGLALAWRLKVVVIGPRENVFHCLNQVDCYPDWETFKSRHWLMLRNPTQGKVHAP